MHQFTMRPRHPATHKLPKLTPIGILLSTTIGSFFLTASTTQASSLERPTPDRSAQPFTSVITQANIAPVTQVYVNPDRGNDQTGNGTIAQPWRTITHALDRVPPNTIIQLTPGTYSTRSGEIFPILIPPQVTLLGNPNNAGREIQIMGGGEVITPTAGAQNVTLLSFDGSGISGITITNPDGHGVWVTGGTPWIVQSTLQGNDGHGIVAHDGTPYVLNNRFADNDREDLELSDRAMPTLEENQFDESDLSDRVRYTALTATHDELAREPDGEIDRDVTIAANRPASRQTNQQTRNLTRNQSRDRTSRPATVIEVEPWQADTAIEPANSANSVTTANLPSYRPLPNPASASPVNPSANLAANTLATNRRANLSDLSIDPDLRLSANGSTAVSLSTAQRPPTNSPIERIPAPQTLTNAANGTIGDRGMAAQSPTPNPSTPSPASVPENLPALAGDQRLPAAPTVPTRSPATTIANSRINSSTTVSSSANTINRPNRDSTASNSANNPANSNVAWGAPLAEARSASSNNPSANLRNNPSNNSSATSATNSGESLLRWNGVTSNPDRQDVPDLPAPIVEPNSTIRQSASQPTTPIALERTTPIATPIATPAPSIAYVPSTVARDLLPTINTNTSNPNISNRSSLPSLLPLPVPNDTPPLGDRGDVPLPAVSGGSPPGSPPPPPGLAMRRSSADSYPDFGDRGDHSSTETSATGQRYRTIVNLADAADLTTVQEIIADAFVTQIDGRSVIQAGTFQEAWRAEALQATLRDRGLDAWVQPSP